MDITLLVDRSDSMTTILDSTLSGLNEFIGSQPPTSIASLHTFDDLYETSIPPTLISEFPTIERTHIEPRGTTALYDAIGHMLSEMTMEPSTIVIITDGQENSSKKFTKGQVMDQITERRRLGWTFIFLAANQDAIASGVGIGIDASSACTFRSSPQEVRHAFRGASNALTRAQSDGTPVEFTQSERELSAGCETPVSQEPTPFRRSMTGY